MQSSSFKRAPVKDVDVESQQAAAGPAAAGAQRHGMILPFVKLVVTFRDIRYFVPMPGEVHPFVVSLAPPYAY